MTAVTVILIRLPTAVETTGIGRSVGRNDFGFRFFFAAMVILETGQAAVQPDPDASLSVDPDLSAPSHAGSIKRLSEVVNQTLPMAMVYRFRRLGSFRPSDRDFFPISCNLKS